MDNFKYRIGSPDNHIGKPPRFYLNSSLSRESIRFSSVYAVRAEDAHYIEETGTAANFRGIVWSQRLWIDIDTQEASTEARAKIKEEGLNHVVYDTGNRGVHIGIARDTKPSHTLPQQDKAWVQSNIPGADFSLYWHLHLIRLPGTVHEKTGRKKRLIYSQEGSALVLPKWEPKEVCTTGESIKTGDVQESRKSIFTTWEVTANLTPTGHRRQLVELSVALKRDSGVTVDEAMWIVKEVNRGFNIPKDENDVERIVRWAYSEE